MRMKKKESGIFFAASKMKSQRKEEESILEGIPKDIPSLLRAYQLTRIASRAGFDWPNIPEVLEKWDEEMEEFREALSLRNRRRMKEELGDLLFVLANIARFLRINPEEALRRTLEKFTKRFQYIETALRKNGKSFQQSNLVEMNQLWEEAKKKKPNEI
jgi:tetrapyrrole methylase family protein/MazG family protein